MIRIHLMRCGDPLPDGAGPSGLSLVGRERLERSALALARLGLWFDLAVCAPDPASVQSARAVLEVLNDPQCQVATDKRVQASASAGSVLEFLRGEPARSLLLVSDTPMLTRLASRMLSGESRTMPVVDLDLEHGGLLCLEAPAGLEGKARLLWSLPPVILAALAAQAADR